MAKAVLKANLPTVLLGTNPRVLSRVPGLARLCNVCSDSEGAGRMAAEHFFERGFEHFAFVGLRGRRWSQLRSDAYCSVVRKRGFDPHVYRPPSCKTDVGREKDRANLGQWIKSLPKPLGVMACNDDRGYEVLDACRWAQICVPEEVAVIGVDNDELFCELADPSLSSVSFDTEHAGYRAAHLLDQQMRGKFLAAQHLVVEPTHVVTRRSTDVKVLDGREVGAAISFIHRNLNRDFTVVDVAKAARVSRRNLEVKFRKATGKTIRTEIQRIRISHVKRALRETDLPIAEIAEVSGFHSASYLTQVFRKAIGETPSTYRSVHRV
jgi:LacI family transcriptional regulator